jgi:nucleoside-diphosphate kinase
MNYSTFVMLKPDAISRDLEDDIKNFLKRNGLRIKRNKRVKVHQELILKHYEEVIARIGEDFKTQVVSEFIGQEVEILEVVAESEDLVPKVRKLIGATDPAAADRDSIRGIYGIDSMAKARAEKRMLRNLIHASDSNENASKEIELWFG